MTFVVIILTNFVLTANLYLTLNLNFIYNKVCLSRKRKKKSANLELVLKLAIETRRYARPKTPEEKPLCAMLCPKLRFMIYCAYFQDRREK